jgi:hypothetical protein
MAGGARRTGPFRGLPQSLGIEKIKKKRRNERG